MRIMANFCILHLVQSLEQRSLPNHNHNPSLILILTLLTLTLTITPYLKIHGSYTIGLGLEQQGPLF